MMDYVSIIVISLFVPILVLGGAKLYGYKNNEKLLKAFAITLLAVDLLRFFYNAKLFANATTPANELRFSYLTIYSVMVMFSAFASGKLGAFFKTAVAYTSLIPFIIAIFNPAIYTNSLDNFSVVKACYFVECGLALLVGILSFKLSSESFAFSALASLVSYAVYVAFNALSIIFWNTNYSFNATWFITVGVSACITLVFAGIGALIKSRR